jgi:UMF1 family MFS transporter
LFDWAAQPFFTLITTFVFAPYFASALAANPAQGQALWGYATAAAGFCIALLSPMLGAVADAGGSRKPWIATFGAFLVVGCALLWFAAPGVESAVAIALVGFVLAAIGAEFATVFNNSMMPTLVPAERIGRLSGFGWAMGYAGGLISLGITLALFAANPDTGRTLAGLVPALGLDPALREGDRFAGPFSALWFLVFVLPMFLFVPDVPRSMDLGPALRKGVNDLKETLSSLKTNRKLGVFLLANMIYQDGLVALFAFGGIYAAGAFGWSTVEIGIFGILLTITGTFGAVIGGALDDRLGSKTVIAGSLMLLLFACVGVLGTTRDSIFFVVAVTPPAPGDGLFAAVSERVYLALGMLIGLVAGPLQSASRTLLVRLAPPEKLGQSFGLFALSGKLTSFIGPMMVAVVTDVTDSQRAGVAVLVVMFTVGMLLLSQVEVPRVRNAPSVGSGVRP